MDSPRKTNRSLSLSRLKKKKGMTFFLVIVIVSLSIVMINFLLIDKKYLKVKLYIYNNKNDRFDFEASIIPKGKNRIERIKDIVNELISGPVGENYERLFSPETTIQFVAMSKRGVVYISFNWNIVKALRKNPAKIIDSIVKSIKKNIKEVKGVKILVNGVESISTFNGIEMYKTFTVN